VLAELACGAEAEPKKQDPLSACAKPAPKDKETSAHRLKVFNIEVVFMT
jgi:hypothetical protein